MTNVKPRVMKTGKKHRRGRGFSVQELKKAGTNPTDALKLAIPIDTRRKTCHDENVEVVQTFLKSMHPKPKPKRKSKS